MHGTRFALAVPLALTFAACATTTATTTATAPPAPPVLAEELPLLDDNGADIVALDVPAGGRVTTTEASDITVIWVPDEAAAPPAVVVMNDPAIDVVAFEATLDVFDALLTLAAPGHPAHAHEPKVAHRACPTPPKATDGAPAARARARQ